MKKLLLSLSLLLSVFVGNAQNNALDFNGSTNYVNCGNIITTTYTKEAWIKLSSNGVPNNIISGSDAGSQHVLWAKDGTVSGGNTGATTVVRDPAGVLPVGVWYHFAVTYNAASLQMKLYKNGVMVSSASGVGFTLGTGIVYLGSYDPGSNFFAGQMDEVRIWNTERTAAEILNNYNKILTGSEPGLTQYYNFNQTSGTTLPDLATSGGTQNGTLINFGGSPWVTSTAPLVTNNSLNFDGTNDIVTIPYNPNLTLNANPFTIEYWARPTLVNLANHWIINKGESNTDVDYLVGLASNNKFTFIARNLSIYFNGTTSAVAGNWYHVANVFDGTSAKIYVNGILEATVTTVGVSNSNTSNVVLGARRESGAPSQFFQGDLDEVRIWNTERTPAQIQNSYNQNLVGNEPGLVAYYNFNQGIAGGTNSGLTTLLGLTTPPNNGTLQGPFALTGATSNWVSGVVYPASTLLGSPNILPTASQSPFQIATGDFNGDGNLDMATANQAGNNVSVFTGTGLGTFGAVANYPAGAGTTGIVTGDFNSDGKLDLISMNLTAGNISVFTGSGTGTFGGKIDIATGPVRNAAVGDINKDGRLDLVIANPNSNNFWLLTGTGTGNFGTPISFTLSAGSYFSTSIADLNKDGNLDVVAVNYTNDLISVRLGNGTGGFGSETPYSTGGATTSLFADIADINQDSNLDILVASQGSSFVSVFTGTGTGTFGSVNNSFLTTPTQNLSAVIAKDINGDGRLDILASNAVGTNISILTSTGIGTFAPYFNINPGGVVFNLVSEDVNNDGKPDIISALGPANSVSVILNTWNTPAPTFVSISNPLSVCGANAAITANFTGSFLQYQWYRNGVSIAGANTVTLTSGFSGAYYVVASNIAGSATSSVTTITACNNALQFNGNSSSGFTDNSVSVSNSSSDFNLPNFTFEAWVNYTGNNGANTIFSKGNGNGANNEYIFQIDGGVPKLYNGHPTLYTLYNSGFTIPSNTWTHVAASYNSITSILGFYVNGNLVNSQIALNFTTPTGAANNDFFIGIQGANCRCNRFNGQIDEARIWNVARTPNDIKENIYRTINGNLPGLVAAYNFNQGIGGGNNSSVLTLIDQAGGNHNGTLNSFSNLTLGGNTSNWVGSITTITGLYQFGAPFANMGTPPSVCLNGAGTYTITATGQGSFSYQWYRNGALLAGQTSATLNLTTALTSTTGTYNVQITSEFGTSTSAGIVFPNCNNALDFDGGDDEVIVGNISQLNLTSNFTAEAWVYNRLNTTGTDFMNTIFSKKTGGGPSGWALFINEWGTTNGRLVFETTNGNFLVSTNINSVPVNQWSHVAVSVNQGVVSMYINGAAVSTTWTGSFSAVSSSTTFRIGNFEGASFFMNGIIDEARIWNIALSQQDIQNNRFKNLSSTTTGLVGYWDMNQGIPSGNNTSITTAIDKSGNGFNGSLIGFTKTAGTSNFVSPTAGVTTTGVYTFFAPTITGISANQTVCSGVTLPLSVTVSGSGLGFQWRKDGVNIAGATAATFTLTGVTSTAAGIYTVFITSLGGNLTSPGISLGVGCNNALQFAGDNDNVSFPLTFAGAPSNQITVEAWVNPSSITTNRFYEIFRADGVTGNGFLFSFQEFGTVLSFGTRNESTWHELDITIVSANYTNQWVHLAATYDGQTKRVYRNGVLLGSFAITGSIVGSNICRLGSEAGSTSFFNGLMDEARIWNIALSQEDIQNNRFKNLSTTTPGLVVYYDFNQGIPGGSNGGQTTLLDKSGNGINGTLTSFGLTAATSNYVTATATTTITAPFVKYIPGAFFGNVALGPLTTFGGAAIGNPNGVATLNDGRIIVSSATRNALFLYAQNGFNFTFLSSIGGLGAGLGQFTNPAHIAVNNAGLICVAEPSPNNRVQVLSLNGNNFVPIKFVTNSFNSPFGIAFGPDGRLYVSDDSNNRFQVFSVNGSNFTFATQYGTSGASLGQFSSPQGLSLGPDSRIYLAEYNNARVQVLSISGNTISPITQFGVTGTAGSASNQLSGTYDTKIDSKGNVYIASYGAHSIRIITVSGATTGYIGQLGTVQGSALNQLNGPQALSFSADEKMVYIADYNNNRISVWGSCDSQPEIVTQPVSQTICGSSLSSITLSAVGVGLSYSWSNGSTAATLATSLPGIYTVTVNGLCGYTFSNPVTVTSVNCALDFDGTDDFVQLPAATYFNDNTFTIEAWVFPRTLADQSRVVDFGNGPFSNNVYLSYTNTSSGPPNLGIYPNAIGAQYTGSTILTPNQWVHLAVVVNGTNAQMYINGVLNQSFSNVISVTSINRTLNYIGKSNWGTPLANMQIDELRIWSESLSQQDINANRNRKPNGNEAGLLAYYDFDQGLPSGNNASITTLLDKSINGYHGTLTGFSRNGAGSNFVSASASSSTGVYLFSQTTILGITSSQTVCSGVTLPLSVTATGSGLAYQWFKDNVLIPSATASSLTLTGVTITSAGTYFVSVTGFGGSITSSGIALGIGCNNALDLQGTTNLANGTYTAGQLPSGNSDFTFETWINYKSSNGGNNYFVWWGNPAVSEAVLGLGYTNTREIIISRYGLNDKTTSVFLPNTTWAHIALTYRGATRQMDLYLNGVLSGTLSAATFTTDLAIPTTGNIQLGSYNGIASFFSNVILDETSLWNIALSQADIQGTMNRTLVGTETGLSLYYDYNNGIPNGVNSSNTILADRNVPSQNLTLSNFTLNGSTSNWVGSLVTSSGVFAFASPSITGISSSQTVCSGVTIPLSVTATGSGLAYQWFRNNVIIPGATASTLTLTGVTLTSSGTYFVSVTGLGGSTTSSGISLGIGCNNALNFDGSNDVISTPGLNIANSSFSFELWAKRNSTGVEIGFFSGGNEGFSNQCYFGQFRADGGLAFGFWGNDLNFGTGLYNDLNWHHYAFTYNHLTNDRKVYRDGVLVGSDVSPSAITANGGSMTIGSRYSGLFYNGNIDEFRVWNIELSQQDIQNNRFKNISTTTAGLIRYYDFNQGISASNNAGLTNLNDRSGNNVSGSLLNFAPLTGSTSNWVSATNTTTITSPFSFALPAITNQTSSQTVCSGVTIPLSVTATGSGLSYQWYKDNVLISGATASILTLTSVTATSAGTYFVSVTGLGGNVTSSGIALGVNTQSLGNLATTFTDYRNSFSQSISAAVSPSTFTLTGGTLPNGMSLNASSGLISGAVATVAGTFNFTITGTSSGGCVASKAFTITVTKANLTVQVLNQSSIQGSVLPVFTSTVAGLIVPDVITYSYSSTATSLSGVGTYPINATVSGAVLSNYNLVVNAGTLTIIPQLTIITNQTSSQTVCSGVTIPLSVTATGTTLTYQWYKDNVLISGATASLYNVSNVTTTSAGTYFVSVTGLGGNATSSGIAFGVGCNNALNFAGNPNQLNLGTDARFNLQNNFTLEAWVRIPSVAGTKRRLFNRSSSNGFGFGIEASGNLGGTNYNVIDFTSSLGSLTANTWNHVAFVVQNNVITYYINGLPSGTAPSGVIPSIPSADFKVGFSDYNNSESFIGDMDEVRIWNVALSATDILANINKTPATTLTGLIATYDFNQGLPNANNSAINRAFEKNGGIVGTLTGFSLTGATSNWVGSVTTINGPYISIPSIATSFQNNNTCSGLTNGSIGIVVSRGTPPYIYNWSPGNPTGNGTATISGLLAGVYVVTVTDINMISAIASYTITQPGAIFDSPVTLQNTSFCGIGNAILSVSGSQIGVEYAARINTSLVSSFVSGNGGTLTLNPTSVAGTTAYNILAQKIVGKALLFNGVNQYIDPNILPTVANNFTVEAWVNPTATHEIDAQSSSGASGTSGQKYILWPTWRTGGAGMGISVGTNGVSVYEHAAGHMPSILVYNGAITGWTHIAVVYTSKQPSLYINGTLVATGLQSGQSNVFVSLGAGNNFSGQVGGIGGGSYGYFQGAMDEFRIWNTNLTQSQIATRINTCLAGNETNLFAYYRFDNGSFSSANDATVNNYNGAILNMTAANITNGVVACGSGNTCPIQLSQTVNFTRLQDGEIQVKGNTTFDIFSNDLTPSIFDGTDFGTTSLSGSITKTFTIENTGTSVLNISNISISGPNAANFSLTSVPITSVANGSSANFTVQFLTTTLGIKNANVVIGNSDCDESVYTFSITANVTAAGSALDFDGNDDYITVSSLNATPSFTYEAWINIPSIDNVYKTIIEFGNDQPYFGLLNGYLVMAGITSDPALMTTNVWNHVAVTFDAATNRTSLYRNGTLVSTVTTPIPNRTGVGMGIGFNTGDNKFFGKMDEVRIWNRALTQAEIQTQMICNPSIGTPNLLARYDFNQGNAEGSNAGLTTVLDRSGNGNNGTATNFAMSGANSNWVAGGRTNPSCVTDAQINIKGNGISIANGNTQISSATGTDFGNTLTGITLSKTFTIENIGTTPLTINILTIIGVDANQFSITGLPSSTINASLTSNFTISYINTFVGMKFATVSIATDDTSDPIYTFAIAGRGLNTGINIISPVAYIDNNAVPTSTNGNNLTNYTIGVPVTLTYTIQNLGTSVLGINSVTVLGSSDFVVTVPPASSIAPGGSSTFTITFTPTNANQQSASVQVLSSEGTFTFQLNAAELVAGALEMSGTNDYIRINPNPAFEFSDGTIEFWINPKPLIVNSAIIANIGDNGGTNTRYAYFMRSDRGAIELYNGSIVRDWPYAFNINQWYHIAIVENGPTVTLYVNGTSLGSNTINSGPITGLPLFIGASSSTGGQNFQGTYDEVRIWNIARTASEIADNYQSEINSTVPGLVAYYKFNQGVVNADNPNVNRLVDASGNGLDGALTNFALTGVAQNWVSGQASSLSPQIVLKSNANFITLNATPMLANNTDFGTVALGTPVSKIFSILNMGNTTLGVSNVVVSGPNASDFIVNGFSASNLTVGGLSNFNIQFNPISGGVKNAIITVNSTDPETPSFSFSVTGIPRIESALDLKNGDRVNLGTNFSVSGTSMFASQFWFKSTDTQDQRIIFSNMQNAANGGIEAYLQFGAMGFALIGSPNSIYTYTQKTFSDGIWHHAAISYNGNSNVSGVQIYIDGDLQNLVTNVGVNLTNFNSNTQNFTIGRRPGLPTLTKYYVGQLDNLSFWNTTLTQAQIRANILSTTLTGFEPGLLAYYDFNQSNIPNGNNTGFTTLANQTTLAGANGTLVGFALTAGNISNWVNSGAGNFIAPIITTVSQNQQACKDNEDDKFFTVSTLGTALNYQWYENGIAVGTNNSEYSVAAFALPISGTYTYKCVVSNWLGSVTSSGITFTVNPTPTVIGIVSPSTVCSGQLTLPTASGANNYEWSDGIINNQAFAPTISGFYTLNGTSSGGCLGVGVVSVTVLALPTLSINPSKPNACFGESITLSSAGTAISYFWNTPDLSNIGANSISINPTITGTYSLTGTDIKGCSANANPLTIPVNALPTISFKYPDTKDLVCQNAFARLNADGANSYTFTGGILQNTDFAIATSTTYTVSGTNGIGCTNATIKTVTVLGIPSVTGTILPSNEVCFGTPVTIAGLGATTYTINGIANNSLAFVANSSGTYTISGSNGTCGSMATVVTLTVNALPIVTASANPATICIGQSTTFAGAGALPNSYTWTGGITNGTSQNPTISGIYTVTGTDAKGCSNFATANITVNNLPNITISGNSVAICQLQSATLIATGASNYTWNNGSTTSSILVSPAATQTYSVTGTDANNCVNTALATVTVLGIPSVTGTILPSNEVCFGTPVTVAGLGATTYTINGIANNALKFIATSSGTYFIDGSNGTCGNGNGSVSLTVNQLPQITILGANATICQTQPTALTATGATSYIWSNNSTTSAIVIKPDFSQGYTVTGTYVNGCSAKANTNITVNEVPVISLSNAGAICLGQSFGITASGLNINSYAWNNGENTASILVSPVITSFYRVTATGINGCSTFAGTAVSVNTLPMFTTITSITIYKSNYNQSVGSNTQTYTLTGGNLPLGLSLSNNGLISGASSAVGNYNFSITGGLGNCTSTRAYTMTVNPALLTVTARDTTVFQFAAMPTQAQFKSSVVGLAQGENMTISYFVNANNTNTNGNFSITPSVAGATLGNYILTTIAGTLRVLSPLQLTANVGNLTREYGNPDPAFIGTVTGINAQFPNVTVRYFTNTSATSGFGIYPILATLTGTDAFRYSLSSVTVGGLTIRTRRLIVRTYDFTIADGQALPTDFPTSILGLLSGSAPNITFETSLIPGETNKYNIIPEIAGIDLNLYSLVLFPGILYVKPAITLTGNSFVKSYGQANPALTGQMAGLQSANPYVYVSFRTDATANSAPGEYAIYPVVTGSDASKYGFVTVLGMLTVSKANLTVAAANQTRLTTLATPFEFSPVFTGLVANDAIPVSFTTNAPDVTTSGTYLVYPSVGGSAFANYNITTVTGTLTIASVAAAPILITVSANNFTKKYGQAEGNYTFITTGNINSADNITISVQSNAQIKSPIGTYTLTPMVSGADLYKYIITTVASTLTIEKNIVTIKALDYAREYGDANPPFFNTSVSGLMNEDQIIAVAYVDQEQFSDAGTYPILTQTIGAVSPNYIVQTVAGIFTINKAILTVIGSTFERMYNQPNPQLAFNIVGYKGQDQIGNINQLPQGQTTAILSSPVQTALYPVIYSQAQDNNYDFAYTDGSLQVVPSTQTIQGFNLVARVKTGESVTLTANASSGLPIEVSVVDTTIVKNESLLMNGKTEGATFVKLKQSGDNNYLPADSILIAIVSTSTGIKTTTLIGIFGSRSMFKGVQSTFQSTEVPGYKYKWSYRPSVYVPQNINWVNPSDTTTTKVSVIFPKNIEVVLPSSDSSRVYMGDITCKVYDDLGNLSKVNSISLILTVDEQAAAIAQLAQTLAVLECPPAVSNCNKTFISTFNFGKKVDTNNEKTDKSCNGGFSDFTTSGKIDTLIMGNPYNFKIGATVASNSSSLIFFALWIDYDNNGSFNDPDDFIRASSEASNVYEINSMAIRNNDKYEGPRRIRVSMKTSRMSPSESCLAEGVVGETEDYMVFLKKPQALEIANLLTPNNDGKNDIFIIKGINPKLTNKLTIMDRDGVIKYQTENYQNDFDGNSEDNRLQDGTYYYFFSQGEDILKGFVEVRRK